MAYCPSKAVFLGPTATTYANPFVTSRTSVVRARAVAVAQRRRPESHRTKLIPCKAISEPAAEEVQQVSFMPSLQCIRFTSALPSSLHTRGDHLQLQGSKLQLPYEVLERAYAQQKLEGQKLRRAHQVTQARLELSEAIEQKARRVCGKVASRSKKMSSRARLLQTQFDRLTSETDTDKLQTTVDEQDHRLSYCQVEAEGYKQKMLRAQVWFHALSCHCDQFCKFAASKLVPFRLTCPYCLLVYLQPKFYICCTCRRRQSVKSDCRR